MPSSQHHDPVLLLGVGAMGTEYAKVLKALGFPVLAVGRSERSGKAFTEATSIPAITGGFRRWISSAKALPTKAIVAVSEESIGEATKLLLKNGLRSILVEKPGGSTASEIQEVATLSRKTHARVAVAYNRRFYASVAAARPMIERDGGVTSFNFEFTEWSHIVENLAKPPRVLREWYLHNSTHVIDLAFTLGGWPKTISSFVSGRLRWYPRAVFAGAGISTSGALFSYQANWAAPGRWSVEVLTRKHRYIFRPMEKLFVQDIGSVQLTEIPLKNSMDEKFKPGLYRQVEAFLHQGRGLCSIDEQEQHLKTFLNIRSPKNVSQT